MQKITIAIDGHSSCGKSTLAKDLARELNYVYVDSGAMYRAVTYYAIQNGWISNGDLDQIALINALNDLNITFQKSADAVHPEVFLNGQNVESKIRGLEISNNVSTVAAIQEVRKFLVEQQRQMGENGGVVMDGRDIGSVVFPNAELKIFLTADTDIRAERRFKELTGKGEDVDLQAIKENLIKRDHLDTTRKESPLKQTEDAVVIDNTHLSKEEQLLLLKQLVADRSVTI